jgi:hypothetical protein
LRNLIPALHNSDTTGAQHPPEHDADAIQCFQQELGHHRLRKHDGGGDGDGSHVRPEAADPEARPSHREGRRFVRVKFVQMNDESCFRTERVQAGNEGHEHPNDAALEQQHAQQLAGAPSKDQQQLQRRKRTYRSSSWSANQRLQLIAAEAGPEDL